jgi:hypothetical protein
MLRISGEHLAIFGMNGRSDDGITAAGNPHSHHHRLRGSCRSVVHAGVGHIHAGQFGDHGLELEDGLQSALGDLGLVRRIAGKELATLDKRIDDDRPVMTIGASAQKAGIIRRVFLSGGAKVVDDLALRLLPRHSEVAFETVFSRNARKEIVNGCRTDLGKHSPALFVGFGEVAHFLSF